MSTAIETRRQTGHGDVLHGTCSTRRGCCSPRVTKRSSNTPQGMGVLFPSPQDAVLLSLQLPGHSLCDVSCGQEVICRATSLPCITCQAVNGLGDNRHNWSSSEVSSPRHKAKVLPVLPLHFMAKVLGRSPRHVQSPPHQPGGWEHLLYGWVPGAG